jgi:CRISPR/Cas system-associated endoribonuclease Cas2
MVEWSDSAEAVNVSEPGISANARERRLNPNRGNRHTEDTLRGYGLMDIASVSALDANPRFVLTRAGHRIYEGSELKNGAKLAAVSATELLVQANGSAWLVPYDVSKPVRRVANSFTTSAQNPVQEPAFSREVSSNDAQSVNAGVAGTPIAVVSMPRGKGIESELVGQSK